MTIHGLNLNSLKIPQITPEHFAALGYSDRYEWLKLASNPDKCNAKDVTSLCGRTFVQKPNSKGFFSLFSRFVNLLRGGPSSDAVFTRVMGALQARGY